VFDSGEGKDDCRGDAGTDSAALCEVITAVP